MDIPLSQLIRAEQADRQLRSFNVVDLVNIVIKEQAVGNPAQMARRLSRVDAAILDELG